MQLRANGIELEVERMGEGEPVVLIMGIGAQLVMWPDDFCSLLVERGFSVIRFDHRDVGRSTHLRHLPAPDPRVTIARAALGLPIGAPYRLEDMADDVAGILDALDLDRAHVVGVSMGGMVAQTFAIRHPRRARTLTSIMSTPGDRRYMLLMKPRALGALLRKPARTRDEAGEATVVAFRTVGGRTHPPDDAFLREAGRRAFDRGVNPAGFVRHLAAICASGSRRHALARLDTPTLVIHGTQDPLLPVAAGRATARLVPNARLLELADMGHDLPKPLRPVMADAIASLAASARARPS
ncbi:MAG: alpha/beta hydrolase [Polyangiaceae bacterium]